MCHPTMHTTNKNPEYEQQQQQQQQPLHFSI